ncbi:ClpXP protease specificity-enhancing factor [Salinispirillum sp. LH 10-3-1]|uniref:ClpXP protease specificity-enhancing factor n=1 Tax=Salinispirillum sp. LH 10-3-1 TaxID=2952525 RepID=A0AB38YDF9_9GAMM
MTDQQRMTDNKPYLIRAMYEWIEDNQCTPYMVVHTDLPGVRVPVDYVEDGKITLNIAGRSVQDLTLGNDEISFAASFGGVVHYISVPCYAVAAMFARENAQGMMFEVVVPEDGSDPDGPPSPAGKPSLKVVK